ncbi:MAG: PKD domain-containing protein, partial [Bacteroidales bacterium]
NPIWPCSGPGNYQVSLSITDIHGCVGDTTMTVIIPEFVQSIFTIEATPMCTHHEISFIDNSIDINEIDTWEWNFGDTPPITYNFYQNTVTHIYSSSGNYNVCLVVKMGNFSDTSCQTITIYPTPVADFINSDTCLGDFSIFNETSTVGNYPIINWFWDFGNNGDTAIIKNPQYLYELPGSYNVELIVTNTMGCQDTVANPVKVYDLPIVGINWDDPCITHITTFTDTSKADDAIIEFWNWELIEQGINYQFNNSTVDYRFNSTGTYPISLTVTDEHGCKNTEDFDVEIYDVPVSDFSMIYNYDNIQGQVKFENNSTGGFSWKWDFDDPPGSAEENPVHTYSYDGEYEIELIVTNEYGCTDDTTRVYEMVFVGLFVPNAFSPEDPDPVVSRFLPSGSGIKEYRIEVFDIWGTMVWSSSALTLDNQPAGPGWDGTYKGKPLPSGVYVWKAHATFNDGTIWKGSDIGDGNKPETQGSLMLIR